MQSQICYNLNLLRLSSHLHARPKRGKALIVPYAVRQEEDAQQAEVAVSVDERRKISNAQQNTALDAASSAGFPASISAVSLSSLWNSIDFSEPTSFDGEEKTEYDPLRDGPLRYLGYANELGEAFAAWLFAGGVPLSYGVAVSYVLFDTWDKYNKTLNEATSKLTSRQDIPRSVDRAKLIKAIALERGVDTVVWQLIASVAAPGFTIHTIVGLANTLLETAEQSEQLTASLSATAVLLGLPAEIFISTINKSIPTAIGLLAIPFIVHPIDSGVHALLNATLRPALRRVVCKEARGCEAGLKICSSKDCQ